MPRYIDAVALYENTAEWEARALAKVRELNRTPPYEMTDEDRKEWRMWTAILGERTAFKHDVADAPTADVVERKKGRWITSVLPLTGAIENKCSECNTPFYMAINLRMNYCPNCGAKMESE